MANNTTDRCQCCNAAVGPWEDNGGICPLCRWEWDYNTAYSYANGMPLSEAKALVAVYGDCRQRCKHGYPTNEFCSSCDSDDA